jgi:hypothetical protein
VPGNRISYQNWIVDIGYDPRNPEALHRDVRDRCLVSLVDPSALEMSSEQVDSARDERPRTGDVRRAVADALDSLAVEEREFIVRFYYMGESYREIAEKSGRALHKLTALHERAAKKLRTRLAGFVREKYHVEVPDISSCPLCRSRHRDEIDRLIDSRDPTATWRPVLKVLRQSFGIKIGSPQLVIGHARHHRQMRPERNSKRGA